MITRCRLTLAALMVVALSSPPALAQHEHQAGVLSSEQVGTVDFRTSCAPAVKDDFNRAVALLHSFWFPEAREEFEAILQTDAACAMAHWGIALTHWGNPFGGLRSAQTIAAGQAAVQRAQATGSPSARERAYIDAVAGLFSSADPGTQRARVVAFERAMAQVAADNPDDVEATIFWGRRSRKRRCRPTRPMRPTGGRPT